MSSRGRRADLAPVVPVARPSEPSPAPPPVRPSSRTTLLNPALLGAVTVAVLTVAAVGARLADNRPGSAQVQEESQHAVSTCPSIAAWLDTMASYERQGLWRAESATVQAALRTPGLCAADREALANKLMVVATQALFVDPPPPEDATGQWRAAQAYADLKALAAQYAQPPPPPLPIGRSANDQRLYLLAAAALGDAFANGEASLADRDVVRAMYTARRNLGLSWAQRPDPALRAEGQALLATACHIDERLKLEAFDACLDLGRLVGPRQRWPMPIQDPLVALALSAPD